MEKTPPIASSTSHTLCPWAAGAGSATPVARVLSSAQQWAEVIFKTEDVALQAPIDWQTQDVLLFALGTQPHLGVSVKLSPRKPPLRIHGHTAKLEVQVARPPPGSIVATAQSQPCVMAVVPKRTWHKLEVRQAPSGALLWQGRISHQDLPPKKPQESLKNGAVSSRSNSPALAGKASTPVPRT